MGIPNRRRTGASRGPSDSPSVGCLLLHGFTGTTWSLEHLGKRLTARGWYVELPLLSGHGTRLEDLNRVRWERWVDEARISFESLAARCDSVYIIGLSMGGTIGLYLAAEKRVAGLVCLATPVAVNAWIPPLVKWMRYVVPSIRKRQAGIQWSPEMGYDRYPVKGLHEFFTLMEETRGRLGRVSCPMLILHAMGDRTIPAWNADLIYRMVSSKEKEKVFLLSNHHTITRGKNQDEVEKRIIRFIEERCGQEKGVSGS